jgi:DNA mismatch repair protein MutL
MQQPSDRGELPPAREKERKEQLPVPHNFLVIGQFENLYIFCKTGTGLLVIDQHAAHERLLYEKLRKQYLSNTIIRQTLMFPETVELSLFQAQLVEKNEQEIDRIGFSIREFGGNTYIISAVPALAGLANPRELFLDTLEQFGSENNRGEAGGFLDTILANMACKAAVKAGTELSRQEIDNLLNDMIKADLFTHCPHGRPVVKQFTKDEIKKWFYRT